MLVKVINLSDCSLPYILDISRKLWLYCRGFFAFCKVLNSRLIRSFSIIACIMLYKRINKQFTKTILKPLFIKRCPVFAVCFANKFRILFKLIPNCFAKLINGFTNLKVKLIKMRYKEFLLSSIKFMKSLINLTNQLTFKLIKVCVMKNFSSNIKFLKSLKKMMTGQN